MNDARREMRSGRRRRHRVALCSVAALLAVPAPHALAQRPRAAAPPLEIAVEEAAGVWSRPDGTGYVNDLVRAAFNASGVPVRFRVMPYVRCKAMVIQRVVPVCTSMSRDPSIPSSIVFSDVPVFTFRSGLYEKVGRPVRRLPGRRLARGTTVGIVRGYEYPDTVYRLQRQGILTLVQASSEKINLRKLAEGRLDAALVNFDDSVQVATMAEKSAGGPGRVALSFVIGTLPGYVGFNREHPQGPAALAQYNAGYRIIAANGVLKGIAGRWADTVRLERLAKAARAARRTPSP